MGLLNAIGAGLGGVASSLAQSYGERNKAIDDERLLKERSRLELEREQRILEMREQMATRGEERKRSAAARAGEEISSGTARMQNERDAAAINAKEGSSMTAEDAAVLRDKPEARKAYGLLNATATESDMRQSQLRDEISTSNKLGLTEQAKERNQELRTEVSDSRAEAATKDANRRMDASEKYQQRREGRLDAAAAAELQYKKSNAEKENTRADAKDKTEARLATAKMLDSVTSDIKSLEKALNDATKNFDEEGIKETKANLAAARVEAAGYRKDLKSVGIKSADEPAAKDKPASGAPYPDGTKLRKGGQTYVVRNGVPVLESK